MEAHDGERPISLTDLICLLIRSAEPMRGTDLLAHAFLGNGGARASVREDDVASMAWLAAAVPAYTQSPAAVRALARGLEIAVEAAPEGRGWRSQARDLFEVEGEWPTSVIGRTEALALLAALAAHVRARQASQPEESTPAIVPGS